MPANANVFIKYGPYKAVGVVQHRDSRLKGLQGNSHLFNTIHYKIIGADEVCLIDDN